MISIIIPTYNEQETIQVLIKYLQSVVIVNTVEIIIADGGSTDKTLEFADATGAKTILSPHKGRAAQMNFGASIATGDVLYFIHADSLPPISFVADINNAVRCGYGFGRYRTRFTSNSKLLLINAFFTRFDLFVCYGGDQTFFITKRLFDAIGGFDASMLIMEDYDIVTRAKKLAKYKIIQKNASVSARKYEGNGWLKVQKANFTIIKMFKKGASQQEMVARYKTMLDYR